MLSHLHQSDFGNLQLTAPSMINGLLFYRGSINANTLFSLTEQASQGYSTVSNVPTFLESKGQY